MINWVSVIAAAFVPLIVGFIWYNPKVMGTKWMELSGVTPESAKESNMVKVFGISLVCSFILAFIIPTFTIHQMGFQSMMMGAPDLQNATSDTSIWYNGLMTKYADNYRTFKHGALHGTLVGLFLVMPVLVTNSLFERKSVKLAFINVAYWTISIALMGGIVCQKW